LATAIDVGRLSESSVTVAPQKRFHQRVEALDRIEISLRHFDGGGLAPIQALEQLCRGGLEK
jgi:hypothetical protein